MNISSLTIGGIKRIVTSEDNIPTILQVINLQTEQKMIEGAKSLFSEISDGYTKIKCYWDNTVYDQIMRIGKDKFNGSVVFVKKYTGVNKTIIVQEFDLIYLMGGEIGEPIPYKEYSNGNMNMRSTNQIDPDSIQKAFQGTGQQMKSPASNYRRPVEPLPPSSFERREPVNGNRQFSSIQLIYAGFVGWALYCRITKLIYKQFQNKNKKLTKLLEFEIMDRHKWTIKCTIFDKEAEKMRDILKDGEVYIFSGGMVKLDTYKKPAHQKDSKFSIIFQEHSKIELAEDDGTISFPQDSVVKIQNLPNYSAQIEVDVVGILKSIGPEVSFTNKSKNEESTKRTIVICDPLSLKECEITIWRDQLVLPESMIHKTIKVESVKTHEYMGGHSLNTWGKTRATLMTNHPFNRFQSQVDSMSFSTLSYKKPREQARTHISSIKQLLSQCQHLQHGETIWSTFRVYINSIKESGKKWYFACPNCRKAVPDNAATVCSICEASFKDPAIRYILNIAISDALGTGSLWTVAHDDFANKILSYVQDCSAQKASKMSEESFYELCRKCLYQQFKVTIVSKADSFPPNYHTIVRHQITAFNPLDHIREARLNLESIRKFC